jgi:hypothetical protein
METAYRGIRSRHWTRVNSGLLPVLIGSASLCVMVIGCARLPVPVQVIHEDQQLVVRTERVSKEAGYTHPISLTVEQMEAILKNYWVQERPASGPLRLFQKTAGPERLFQESDLRILAPKLTEGLEVATSDEHVAFALYSPGQNPNSERFVTSGWIAVRDPYLHIDVTNVRNLQPRATSTSYYPFFQETPSSKPLYHILFEPQRFWVEDPIDGVPAVQFRDYLRKTVIPNEGE